MSGTSASGRASRKAIQVSLLFALQVYMGHGARTRLAALQAPADGKPSAGEETPAAEVNTASSGQAEASAEKQAHAAGGSEAKDADVQQEESGTEQLQKQPSEASLEVSATVGMQEWTGCSHHYLRSLSAQKGGLPASCCQDPNSNVRQDQQATSNQGPRLAFMTSCRLQLES